jgi:two-component system, chemotaxis family, chemotaxis protein CheY
MKTLIVEDDMTCRLLLEGMLKAYGKVDCVENGEAGVEAVREALDAKEPYDLICMDIMMPVMDGQQAVETIRDIEDSQGILYSDQARIVMTTALDDFGNVTKAYGNLCDLYVVKPIQKEPFLEELRRLKLIE